MTSLSSLIDSARVVLIEFFSADESSRRMMPVIADMRNFVGDRAAIYQLDANLESQAALEAGVSTSPTFILFCEGVEVWRHTGETDGRTIVQEIEQY